jgi:spermidine/putrescine transport system substrate-binding protein
MRSRWDRSPFLIPSFWKPLAVFFCFELLGSGCTQRPSGALPTHPAYAPEKLSSQITSSASGAASEKHGAAATLAASSEDRQDSPRIVHVAIWSNYLSTELIASFEKQTGIHIQVSNYSSNEELLAKLQAGASGYDVAVPSDYMVWVMRKLQLLQPLDFQKLPEARAIEPQFLRRDFDPEQTHSVPYNWTTTGIAIRKDRNLPPIKTWKDVFERPELTGKFSLLDDAREVIGAALRAQGHSLNSRSEAELQAAKDLLLKTRSRIKAFTSEPKMPLIQGEFALSQVYSSDALQAGKASHGRVDYIVPEDGCTLSIESLVIPQGAKHRAEAHALINFLISARANQLMTRSLLLAPIHSEALALLPLELKQDPRIFPPQNVLSKCEMVHDLGETLMLWDRIWTEIKAQRD